MLSHNAGRASSETYHSPSAGNVGTRCPDPSKNDATKATITNLLQNFKSVLEGELVARRTPMSQVVCDSHFVGCDQDTVYLEMLCDTRVRAEILRNGVRDWLQGLPTLTSSDRQYLIQA